MTLLPSTLDRLDFLKRKLWYYSNVRMSPFPIHCLVIVAVKSVEMHSKYGIPVTAISIKEETKVK